MLVPVSEAIQRFRCRLQWAAFVRGLLLGFFVLAATVAALLLAERFVAREILGAGSVGAEHVRSGYLASVPTWSWWAAVAAGALLIGAVIARRQVIDDAVVVAHLEKRLSTNGLLLAASQGVELDASFVQRLSLHLGRTESVLPVIRWRALSLRPIAAALLLTVVQWLPPVAAEQPAVQALAIATQRLDDELQQLDERPAVPEQRVAELRRAVADLNERAEAGENGLWREIDQLRERIYREHKLADSKDGTLAQQSGDDANRGNGSNSSGDSSNPGEGQLGRNSNEVPSTDELAEAMAQLGALDAEALKDLNYKLPFDLDAAAIEAIEDAVRPDGSVDASALPEDQQARRALADALAETASELADELANDRSKLAVMAAGLSESDQQKMIEQLADLAAQFQPSSPNGDQPSVPELSAELAKAALEMAKAGALDDLPDGMKEAMMAAGASALESMDVETLMAMLPDDLSSLMSMAESVAKLAEGMQGELPQAGDPQSGEPDASGVPDFGNLKLSKAMQEKMATLAKGLMEKMGKSGFKPSGQGPQPGALAKGNQQGGQSAGPPGRQLGSSGAGAPRSQGQGSGIDGGGHAALRMTEDTPGGSATKEMILPELELGELPTEWVPFSVEKATPEVSETQTAGAGRAGASGSGGATWQLRLMPRHRDVVRRFFAEKKK